MIAQLHATRRVGSGEIETKLEARGWHWRSTRAIPAGTTVLREAPLAAALFDGSSNYYCASCFALICAKPPQPEDQGDDDADDANDSDGDDDDDDTSDAAPRCPMCDRNRLCAKCGEREDIVQQHDIECELFDKYMRADLDKHKHKPRSQRPDTVYARFFIRLLQSTIASTKPTDPVAASSSSTSDNEGGRLEPARLECIFDLQDDVAGIEAETAAAIKLWAKRLAALSDTYGMQDGVAGILESLQDSLEPHVRLAPLVCCRAREPLPQDGVQLARRASRVSRRR